MNEGLVDITKLFVSGHKICYFSKLIRNAYSLNSSICWIWSWWHGCLELHFGLEQHYIVNYAFSLVDTSDSVYCLRP